MKRKVNDDRRKYWADLCIASSQVFLGVSAATLFTSPGLDFGDVFVIWLTLIFAVSTALTGWRLLK